MPGTRSALSLGDLVGGEAAIGTFWLRKNSNEIAMQRCRSHSALSNPEQTVNAEPSWSRGNQQEKDYDVHDLGQIQEIVKPSVEFVCGCLLVIGLLSILCRMAFIIDMIVAITAVQLATLAKALSFVDWVGAGIPFPHVMTYFVSIVSYSKYPPAKPGAYVVSRSKRLLGSLARPQYVGRLKAAHGTPPGLVRIAASNTFVSYTREECRAFPCAEVVHR